MPAAGYSGTPLFKKLGIQPAMKLKLVHAPAEYPEWLEGDIRKQMAGPGEIPDLIHLFAASEKIFLSAMQELKPLIKKNPQLILWISWYKKSSGISTDLDENAIRQWALKNGLVDVKVCAVSEAWSGLKLVVPLRMR